LSSSLTTSVTPSSPSVALGQLVVLGQVFQHGQHPLGAAVADGLDVAAFLQQLAADVQRQVGRIDHALDEAQVGRQQGLGIVHDEDALDVQLDAGLLVAVPQVHRRLAGDVEQLGVLGAAFDAVVRPGQRRLEVVADGLVELGVLLFADVFLGTGPQRRGLVHGFPLAGLDHAAGLAAAVLVTTG
jgi:hypothetical protein